MLNGSCAGSSGDDRGGGVLISPCRYTCLERFFLSSKIIVCFVIEGLSGLYNSHRPADLISPA